MCECDTCWKDLQSGMPDGALVILIEYHMKETSGCVLTPAIEKSLDICPRK